MTPEMEEALKQGIRDAMATPSKAVAIVATEDGGLHVEHVHDTDTIGVDVALDRLAVNWSRKF